MTWTTSTTQSADMPNTCHEVEFTPIEGCEVLTLCTIGGMDPTVELRVGRDKDADDDSSCLELSPEDAQILINHLTQYVQTGQVGELP